MDKGDRLDLMDKIIDKAMKSDADISDLCDGVFAEFKDGKQLQTFCGLYGIAKCQYLELDKYNDTKGHKCKYYKPGDWDGVHKSC